MTDAKPSIAERIELLAETIHNKPWSDIDNRAMAERFRAIAAELGEIAKEIADCEWRRKDYDDSTAEVSMRQMKEWADRLARREGA